MKYKDLDFVGLSKILRAHATQILPPGMRELKNVYASRSDNSISLRPDLAQTENSMPTLTDDGLQGGNYPEFLTGLYRVLEVDGYIYFSNVGPFSFEDSVRTELSSVYKEGTVTASGTNPIVYGNGTEWLKYVWEGCLLIVDGVTGYYQITSVESDGYITTIPTMPFVEAADYRILRTHPMSNGEWQMQFEKLGDLLVYNPANPTLPTDRTKISGPFYSDIGKADIFGIWKEFEPPLEPMTGDYYSVAASVAQWPIYYAYLGHICPLLIGGANGLIATNEQWVGDYNYGIYAKELTSATFKNEWVKILEDYTYNQPHTRLSYPEGNTYPVVDVYRVIPFGSDARVVKVTWNGADAGKATLSDGSYVYFSGEFLIDRDYEARRDDGPWIPTQIDAPVQAIDPPAYGEVTDYVYGSNGQIRSYPAAPLVTGVTTDIFGATRGEDPLGGYQIIFVGGIDGHGPTVLRSGGTVERVSYHYGVGDDELYDITYMLAQDHGASGIGTFVAVGANGTIIYSDDGGETWDPVIQSIGDNHLRAVMADMQGQCVLAGGDDGTCLVSIDAENWEEVEITTENIRDISYDWHRGEFVVIAEGGADPIRVKRRMRYGTGGQVTVKRVGIISTTSADVVYSVIWDGTQFIAAGNKIWTSPDGVTWTMVEDRPGEVIGPPDWAPIHVSCLAHNGAGVVVGVGQTGGIVRSADDGATWTTIYGNSASTLPNPDITGAILSVIWDGYNFFCCGDKVILRSADGITWTQEASFTATEQPVFLAYNGLQGTSSVSGNDYGFTDGNIQVICKSGAWYYCQNNDGGVPDTYTDWTKWEDGIGSIGEFVPTPTAPGSLVAGRSYFRAASTNTNVYTQEFWSCSLWGTPGQHIEMKHLGPRADLSTPTQEPGVLRIEQNGTPNPMAGNYGMEYNNLIVHDEREATPILLWVHCGMLLVSTDGGQTWSKGYPIKIPTSNLDYDEPLSGEVPPGELVRGFRAGALGLQGSNPITAMVSDGVDVFMATPYAPDGIVFVNLTWDGLKVELLDPDGVPAGPEVLPPYKVLYSSSGEKIVFTSYSVLVT